MSDKKNPHQDFVNDGPSDDDVIIELTDEVEPQIGKRRETPPDESPALKLDKGLTSSEAEDSHGPSVDGSPMEIDNEIDEDAIIASAIEESLGPDENDTINLAEEIEPFSDDIAPILKPDEQLDDTANNRFDSGAETALEMENNQQILDAEEEIDLEFEGDETDTDLFAVEDQQPLEFDPAGDLPDLASQIDIDLDGDDDEKNGEPTGSNDWPPDSDEDMAAPLAENSLTNEQTREKQIQAADDFDFADDQANKFEPAIEEPDDDDSHKDTLLEQQDLLETEPEETLEFEPDDNVSQRDDDFEFETSDENEESVIPLNGLVDAGAQPNDDITEITEFDEYFPADDAPPSEAATVLGLSDAQEDEFIELIDVEEDSTVDDEEVINFGDPQTESVDDDINRFFSEAIEEEATFEKNTSGTLGDLPDNGITENIVSMDPMKVLGTEGTELPATEHPEDALSHDNLLSDEPKQPDTLVPQSLDSEPAVASLPTEPAADDRKQLESLAGDATARSLPANLAPDQIETAIERVIDEKFSNRIESIIYDVIEKAVTREITRLKKSLFQNDDPDDNPGSAID